MIVPETTLRRKGDVLYAPVGSDRTVMLSVSAGSYFGLNSVGTRIWELLATPMTVADICARLCEEFEVEAEHCRTAVLQFAEEVVDKGLVYAA